MAPPAVRYRSPDEDSARWTRFAFRGDDIVISTRSKHGTTWMQTIIALLVFGSADLPAPLGQISPWLDWLGVPEDDVFARLERQHHRRFIKTHTPLDGLPLDPRADFVVVARSPLDAAVSLYHQGDNLDRRRIAELTGQDMPDNPPAQRPPVAAWLRRWIESDADPAESLDSLPGVMHHLVDAWDRRTAANVVLVHYDDLLADLPTAMTSLATRLGFALDASTVRSLAVYATFDSMSNRSAVLVPDPAGVLIDPSAFFRRGRSGSAAEVLDADDCARYRQRAQSLLPADLDAWLHRS